MVPVILLTDGYIANGAEPWLIPDPAKIPPIVTAAPRTTGDGFQPYLRDDELARPWAAPGTAGLEHRIGGLEKQDVTGNVSYDAKNHHHMVQTRAQKVQNITHMIPPIEISGPDSGELLVVGWGGTYGAITAACNRIRATGRAVSNIHLRHMNPFPADLGDVLRRFRRILTPELNLGQLRLLLQGRYGVEVTGFNKVQGKPFLISELEEAICRILDGEQAEVADIEEEEQEVEVGG
jgi:2-oxoglutarate ferredoxin oxidoreductase subunit alpha